MWYSQQAEEGTALGNPLGFGWCGGIKLVRVVGNEEEEQCDGMDLEEMIVIR